MRFQAQSLPEDGVILLLLGGDSLCVGAGSVLLDEVPTRYQMPNPNIEYWFGINGSYSFVPISVPFDNNYPLQDGYYFFGAEMKCAKALFNYYKKAGTCLYRKFKIFVVKYGQGGATVSPDSATPYNYDLFIEQAKGAMDYITTAMHRTPIVPVAYFNFGTNDGNQDIAFANAFQDNLNAFYSNIKTDLNLPDLKIGIGRVSINSAAIHKDVTNEKLDAFVAEDTNNRFQINTDDCEMYSDNIHRTANGYISEGDKLFLTIRDFYSQ